MIVDDADEIRHLLRMMFDTEGFDVVGEAADGPNALVLAMRHEPDFIVLDYMMPRMDGLEVLRRIRSDPRTAGLRVVVMSMMPDWSVPAEASRLGADFWPKSDIDERRIGEALGAEGPG